MKPDNNVIMHLELILKLLKSGDKTIFMNGITNSILGYFNKFLNGIDETIGADNEVVDDGTMKWHAEKIGRGGFGTVLKVTKRACTSTSPITVAIKLIPIISIMAPNEALNAAKLNHPNVVKVYNSIFIRQTCCIEMEYLHGSLQDLIDQKTTFPSSIFKTLFQCCEVLLLMKQQGMVHSDIKPGNILVKKMEFDNDGNCTNIDIADFGLTQNSFTITTQIRGGTSKYCSPEFWDNEKQIFKGKPTFHSDLYSLGKTFKELIKWQDNLRFIDEMLDKLISDNPEERENELRNIAKEAIGICRISDIWEKGGYLNDYFKTKQAIRDKKLSLQKVSLIYRRDREIVLEAIKINGTELEFASDLLKKDREIVLEAIKKNGSAFEFASDLLKKDREFVLQVVKQNGCSLAHADESLKKDREFILELVELNCRVFEFADESVKQKREFVLEIVKQNGLAFKYVHNSLKSDKEVALEAIKQNGLALAYADKHLKSFKEIALEAVKQNGLALAYADEHLKSFKEIVLEAVKQNGLAFKYADKQLKSCHEIALEAVKQNGLALAYSSELVKRRKEIVLEAVKQNGLALEYASESVKRRKEIVLEAVKQNGLAFKHADKSLKSDKEVVAEAIKKNGFSL